MITRHTLSATVYDLDAAEDVTARAKAHVVRLQGIIDSIETRTVFRSDGGLDVTVDVDYEPADPS